MSGGKVDEVIKAGMQQYMELEGLKFGSQLMYERIQQLEAELETSKVAQRSMHERVIDQKEQRAKDFEMFVKDLKAKDAELDDLKNKNAELAELKKQLAALNDKHQNVWEGYKTQKNGELYQRCLYLEEQNTGFSNTNHRLQQKVEDLIKDNADLKAALEVRNQAEEKRVERWREAVRRDEVAAKKRDAEIAELTKGNEKLRGQNAALKENWDKQRQQIKDLYAELDQLKRENQPDRTCIALRVKAVDHAPLSDSEIEKFMTFARDYIESEALRACKLRFVDKLKAVDVETFKVDSDTFAFHDLVKDAPGYAGSSLNHSFTTGAYSFAVLFDGGKSAVTTKRWPSIRDAFRELVPLLIERFSK